MWVASCVTIVLSFSLDLRDFFKVYYIARFKCSKTYKYCLQIIITGKHYLCAVRYTMHQKCHEELTMSAYSIRN